MYSIEEIKEIIDNAVLEECKNYNDSSSRGYIGVQSLKTRLYDAFGLEDDDIRSMKVKIIKVTPVIEVVSPWYRDKIGEIYTVSNKKVDMGLEIEGMYYRILGKQTKYLRCCDCEIVN